MIERLPTPWGLVRLGVAPDHPKIKAVSRAFEKIAAQPGFRFLGNVEVGRDLTHDDLSRLYDAVVYAVGAQTDRRMGIPGEDLPGSWPATEFVAWYNGHPDFQDLSFDLSGERAVVVGAGNVAIDVARMLALTPEEIRPTDTTDAAIDAILGSGLKEIVLLARRGPAQAAFTTPELKELGELADADVIVDPADLELDPASEASLETDTNARRNVEVLREYAARAAGRAARRRSACASASRPSRSSARSASRRSRSYATASSPTTTGRVRGGAHRTSARRSRAGSSSAASATRGSSSPGVPFERRPDPERAAAECGGPGVYCAGWIKRGPSGVIGTNKKDATETVELLLEDARAGKLRRGDPERDRGDRRRAARRARRRGRRPTRGGRRST